jgi:hypothetical protein
VATLPLPAAGADTPADINPEEHWRFYPVNWSAVWVGTLAGVAAVLLFGLVGVAVGAHLVTPPDERTVSLKALNIATVAYSIFTAFLAFVIGGWVAATVGGIRRAEPAIFHGVVAWLVALPVLALLGGLGAGSYLGGWYGGVTATPNWTAPVGWGFDRPDAPLPAASETERVAYANTMAKQWREDTARATRNVALTALTALLLGLMGSVVGGWMASGERMWFDTPRPVFQSTVPQPQTQTQTQRVLVP